MLHHVPDPSRAIAESARVLQAPAARALVIDMLPHDRVEYQQQMGHVWLGFPESQMRKMLTAAGFNNMRHARAADRAGRKGPGAVCCGRAQKN